MRDDCAALLASMHNSMEAWQDAKKERQPQELVELVAAKKIDLKGQIVHDVIISERPRARLRGVQLAEGEDGPPESLSAL